jgi:shikimate dehydrogenase
MKHIYLLGYPLGHSVSPAMHNAAFQELGIDWEYAYLETPLDKLSDAIARLREDACAGANVTIPHKQAVMPMLDEISETARMVNAVNTIVNREGRLFGDNTDAAGFIVLLAENHIHPRNARVGVLGAGGAASAVAYALAAEGAHEIHIINRSGRHAAELADRLHLVFPKLNLATNWKESLADAHILVNATSIGMYPDVADSPMPPGLAFSPHTIVVDLVYNPAETKFLADAKQGGARTIGGLGMLVHQGASAFTMWTGRAAPIETMRKAARDALLKWKE